jgi:hypothetical protein
MYFSLVFLTVATLCVSVFLCAPINTPQQSLVPAFSFPNLYNHILLLVVSSSRYHIINHHEYAAVKHVRRPFILQTGSPQQWRANISRIFLIASLCLLTFIPHSVLDTEFDEMSGASCPPSFAPSPAPSVLPGGALTQHSGWLAAMKPFEYLAGNPQQSSSARSRNCARR